MLLSSRNTTENALEICILKLRENKVQCKDTHFAVGIESFTLQFMASTNAIGRRQGTSLGILLSCNTWMVARVMRSPIRVLCCPMA